MAIPLGVLAARRHNGAIDRLIAALSTLSFSLPVFMLGCGLVYLLATHLGVFPVQGYAPLSAGVVPHLSHLILPALSLGSIYIAVIARINRSTMLEALAQN